MLTQLKAVLLQCHLATSSVMNGDIVGDVLAWPRLANRHCVISQSVSQSASVFAQRPLCYVYFIVIGTSRLRVEYKRLLVGAIIVLDNAANGCL